MEDMTVTSRGYDQPEFLKAGTRKAARPTFGINKVHEVPRSITNGTLYRALCTSENKTGEHCADGITDQSALKFLNCPEIRNSGIAMRAMKVLI
jgi:hypothetical protein